MKCEKCKNKAEITYSESTMDFIHGNKQILCNKCYKKILLKRKEDVEDALKDILETFPEDDLKNYIEKLEKKNETKTNISKKEGKE